MKTILGYLLSPVFHFYYWMMLIVFHPFQVAGDVLFGDKTRKKVVDMLNHNLVRGLSILGCRITFAGFEKIPLNRPLIIVSNHQSMYDIPAVVYGFREFYPRFISKKELGRYYPSISYNLRKGKSALIDRKKGTQAVKEIFKVGQLIRESHAAVCIFPEGTRSKTGKVNKFQSAGIHTLLHAVPDAVIIPFVIDGHSQLMRKGYYPLTFGQRIRYTVLDPVEPDGRPIEELVGAVKERIVDALNRDIP